MSIVFLVSDECVKEIGEESCRHYLVISSYIYPNKIEVTPTGIFNLFEFLKFGFAAENSEKITDMYTHW